MLGSGEFSGREARHRDDAGTEQPDGGVLVGGAANYIINRSRPQKQAAAYAFAKFLVEPQTQADWAAATGYVPVGASRRPRWSR